LASLVGLYDQDAAPKQGFDPIPADDYKLEITEADVVATSKGTGQLLKYTTSVIEGPHTGALVFGTINLVNDSPQAQEIGQGQFAALREALGVGVVTNTDELLNKAFLAKVVIEPERTDRVTGKTYSPRNSIKHFYKPGAVPPAGKPPVAANDNTPKAANDNAPQTAKARPWGNRAAA
jgi:hypothetical protein